MNRGEVGGPGGGDVVETTSPTRPLAYQSVASSTPATHRGQHVAPDDNRRRSSSRPSSQLMALAPDSMELWPPETIMACPGTALRRPATQAA